MGDIRREMFKKGMELYKQNHFDQAREIFNELLSYEEYFYKAMRMIVKSNIRQYRYREARELIKNCLYLDHYNTLSMLASIDDFEYNYKASISGNLTAISKMRDPWRTYRTLSDVYINTGEFDKALDVLTSIRNKDFVVVDMLRFVLIDIILGKYEDALQSLSRINLNSINNPQRKVIFMRAYYTIIYFLEKEPKLELGSESTSVVRFKEVLFGDESLECLKIKIKMDQIVRKDHLYLSPDLDISRFIEDVRKNIVGMNPRFSNMTQVYSVKLNYPIGKINEDDVYGVSVRTPIGSDKIISMVVTDFSSDFDKEGLSTDADLRKRLMIK